VKYQRWSQFWNYNFL